MQLQTAVRRRSFEKALHFSSCKNLNEEKRKEEEKLRQKHFDSALPEQEHVPVAQVFAATTFVSMVFFFISNSVLPS